MPPTGIQLTGDVRVAGGDDRQPGNRRGSLIGAIVLSAGLHLSICGLALRVAPSAVGSEQEEPVAIEVVLAPPSAGTAAGAEAAGGAVEAPAPASGDGTNENDVPAPPDMTPDTAIVESQPVEAKVPAPVPAKAVPRRRPVPQARASSARPQREAAPAAAGEVDAEADGAAASAAVGPGTDAPDGDGPPGPGREGPGTAMAGAGAAPGRAEALDAYRRVVWARIDAQKPKGLRLPGRTGVSFTVAIDGTLLAARIARSSGNGELDRLALLAVQSAAPLPPPPAALGGQPMTFEIPFTFR
ncbi:MAG: TonB family protein [Rhodospirillales bacterium]